MFKSYQRLVLTIFEDPDLIKSLTVSFILALYGLSFLKVVSNYLNKWIA